MRGRILTAFCLLSTLMLTAFSYAGGVTSAPPCAQQQCVTKCETMASVPWYKVIAMYPANRLLDAMDIFRIYVSAGPGVGANVRTTQLVATAGSGNYCATCVGMRGRVLPAFEETVNECGASLLGNVTGTLQCDPTEIGVTAHALVGVNVAASVAEAVDFAVGFVCVDLQGDDLTPSPWD